ncbi:uncharacterized protein N7487_008127 [Penicillium crustosum]|uniref:uncharacterized protein n=1 Tax=Penicillium crustosum TaxID=36656 RepID=UPI0023A5CFC4|nr:uncharacterized protein N7487_008127 [Penicillium crustosum]KAJ5402231.1 hypothetical protein N7487_008127 [Penicillium crustosum]
MKYTVLRSDQTQLSPRRPEPAHDIIQELPPKLTPVLPTSSIPPASITTTPSITNIQTVKMFRFSKTLDPITLFHSPSIQASTRTLNILKQASSTASETATEDQASDHSTHAKQQRDQLRSILDYISPVSGVGGPGEKVTYGVAELVKGARDAEDALKKFKENNENFVRPITVDWVNGRAVIGDNQSEILRMVRQLPAN